MITQSILKYLTSQLEKKKKGRNTPLCLPFFRRLLLSFTGDPSYIYNEIYFQVHDRVNLENGTNYWLPPINHKMTSFMARLYNAKY